MLRKTARPKEQGDTVSTHILSVKVENKPGVLSRISSMFARRGFNIHSLAVGPSEEAGMSRMTLVVDGLPDKQPPTPNA